MVFENVIEMAELGSIMAMITAWAAVISIVAIAFYVYSALVLMTIAKKLKYKNSWLAWIPIANCAMILELGGFHWAWIFLIFLPILGWIALMVLTIIAGWKIFERRKYPGWLSLISLLGFIPGLNVLAAIACIIIWGLVAWKDM